MITTGMIIAHSRMSGGAKKSSQKYPIMASNANAKSSAPKDLFLNCFSSRTLTLTPLSLKTFEAKIVNSKQIGQKDNETSVAIVVRLTL